MQKLSDQQKTELIKQGHSWSSEFEDQQEFPIVFFDLDGKFSCSCSNDLVAGFDFWRIEHQVDCALSAEFDIIKTQLKES